MRKPRCTRARTFTWLPVISRGRKRRRLRRRPARRNGADPRRKTTVTSNSGSRLPCAMRGAAMRSAPPLRRLLSAQAASRSASGASIRESSSSRTARLARRGPAANGTSGPTRGPRDTAAAAMELAFHAMATACRRRAVRARRSPSIRAAASARAPTCGRRTACARVRPARAHRAFPSWTTSATAHRVHPG